jgi:hypothetical protein
MSSRLSHRPVHCPIHRPYNRLAVGALLFAVLLALAAPPAQAAQGSSFLDHLGSKVQSWLASWLPGGVRVDGAGLVDHEGGAAQEGRAQEAGRGNHRQGRAFHPVIRPQCDISPGGDPNGCPSH